MWTLRAREGLFPLLTDFFPCISITLPVECMEKSLLLECGVLIRVLDQDLRDLGLTPMKLTWSVMLLQPDLPHRIIARINGEGE